MNHPLLTFGICAPSSYAQPERFNAGIEKLRALGHELIIHPQATGRLGDTQSAGTVEEKLRALYDLSYDPRVDAILFAGGGNFALHLLETIDYGILTNNPKPIIGFSDATALLNSIHHYTGLVTYHGPMVNSFGSDRFNEFAWRQMIEVIGARDTPPPLPMDGAQMVTPGAATGKLIGGNFQTFQHLLFTPDCPELDGALLFLEDIGVEYSHFDRTLIWMRHAGIFDRVAGLVFGQFTDMHDTGRPFGFGLEEIIRNHTRGFEIPIVMNAPFGHIGMFATWPIGANATLRADDDGVQLLLAK